MLRRVLSLVAAAALAAPAARGQEPAASPARRAIGTGRFAALANELALYSPFESPWADIRVNHTSEAHLFGLMRAEVRLWDLQDTLTAQNSPAREDAAEVARIVHEQILAEAAGALPLLQKTPNKAFAQLLVHQLEAYPYEWKEEGSAELLPNLRKLTAPNAGKPPTAAANNGRRRRRPAVPAPAATPDIPVAPAVRPQ